MQPRLTRSPNDRMVAGVCGGLGNYFGVDPVIVRLIFVVLAITTFSTPFIYPVLWLIMPEAGSSRQTSFGQESRSGVPIPPDARFDPMTGQPLPPNIPPAQTVNFQQADTPPPTVMPPRSRNRMLGMLLLSIGGIVLINNVADALSYIFGVDFTGIIFPILLVGVGVYLLRRKTI